MNNIMLAPPLHLVDPRRDASVPQCCPQECARWSGVPTAIQWQPGAWMCAGAAEVEVLVIIVPILRPQVSYLREVVTQAKGGSLV